MFWQTISFLKLSQLRRPSDPYGKTMLIPTVEDVPLYNNSLRIMKFWSFLLRHNWRRYFSLTPYVILTSSQFVDIFCSTESMDAIIRNAYLAVLFFNTTLRGIVVCIYRTKYEEFLERIRLLYIGLMVRDDIYEMVFNL